MSDFIENENICTVPVSYLLRLQNIICQLTAELGEALKAVGDQGKLRVSDYKPLQISAESLEYERLVTDLKRENGDVGGSLAAALHECEQLKRENSRLLDERNVERARIGEFEHRAGCSLEQIPVEALGKAQDESVNAAAVDALKRENLRLKDSLGKELNRAESRNGDFELQLGDKDREIESLRNDLQATLESLLAAQQDLRDVWNRQSSTAKGWRDSGAEWGEDAAALMLQAFADKRIDG